MKSKLAIGDQNDDGLWTLYWITDDGDLGGELGDEFVADFAGQLDFLFQRQLLDVGRVIHHVEVSAHRVQLHQS